MEKNGKQINSKKADRQKKERKCVMPKNYSIHNKRKILWFYIRTYIPHLIKLSVKNVKKIAHMSETLKTDQTSLWLNNWVSDWLTNKFISVFLFLLITSLFLSLPFFFYIYLLFLFSFCLLLYLTLFNHWFWTQKVVEKVHKG